MDNNPMPVPPELSLPPRPRSSRVKWILVILIVIVAVGAGFYFGSARRAQELYSGGTEPVGSIQKLQSNFSYKPCVQASSSDAIGALVNANNCFAFNAYEDIKESSNGNIFFSPYSISEAAGMVYEGARGETALQIQNVFEFPDNADARKSALLAIYNDLNSTSSEYALNVANAVWVERDFPILDDYLSTVRQYYGGEATNLDFAGNPGQATDAVNKWVSDKTSGKIPTLFDGPLSQQAKLVLTDAIYFKGSWAHAFEAGQTKPATFRPMGGASVQVPTMQSVGSDNEYAYAETDDLQLLELPYKGNKLDMVIILPKSDDPSHVESLLSPQNLTDWERQAFSRKVDMYIPKFTFSEGYDLGQLLQGMGMTLAFDSHPGIADFSGIDGKKDLYIDVAVHKAFVAVDEKGTEAAAATGFGFAPTMAVFVPPPRVIFRADHPFIFLIQDVENGDILFLGKVVDPKS